MNQEIQTFDRVHMEDVIAGRSDIVDLEQIEDALMIVKASQKKIDFLKRLKQYRVKAIDAQVKSEESRIDALKQAITKCMIDKKEKTIDFPDLAKITIRKTKGTWTITDEESLAKHLKSLGKFDDVGEFIVKFNKTKLNKTLDELEVNNNTSDAVQREEDKSGLSVSFHESMLPVDSIDDLLPPPLPKPVLPASIPIIPMRKIDTSEDSFDVINLKF